MTTTLDTVRRLIGRRSKISRQEMADILSALDLSPEASTIAGRDASGRLIIGSGGPGMWTAPASDQERAALARAWANMCCGICTVSVLVGSYYRADDLVDGLTVRYDETGSMHPLQRAELLFAPAALERMEYDQIGQLRRHARRVLVVRDDLPIADPHASPAPDATTQAWISRLRRHRHIDGTWNRILDDGTLEMRDPNDGQSSDPLKKSRYQYRIDAATGVILERHLPPESVGDAWLDSGVPEWEHCYPGGLVREIIAFMAEEQL